jgi:hypothetical protein
MGKPALQWTEAMLAQLGTEKDAVLAERWGTSAKTVNLKRNALGIAAHGHFVWTPEADAQLGLASDAQVAQALGISKASVVARRQVLGIASATAQAGQASAFDWTPEAVALLGSASDAAVAAQLGLSRLTVQQARTARGISPAGRSAQVGATGTP